MKLSKEEREIVITKSDDENEWQVFSDSSSGLNSKLLKVVRSLGLEPTKTGEGWRAILPKKSITFRGPRKAASAKQVARGKQLGDRRKQQSTLNTHED